MSNWRGKNLTKETVIEGFATQIERVSMARV